MAEGELPQIGTLQCPQCGTIVPVRSLGGGITYSECPECGLFMPGTDVPLPRERGERLRAVAHPIGRFIFQISGLGLLGLWCYVLFGWIGFWGIVIGVVAFPTVYVAPFVMFAVGGVTILSLVTLGFWVANIVGVALLLFSRREQA